MDRAELHQVIDAVIEEKVWEGESLYYAWGRMDGGAEPVVVDAGMSSASSVSTAREFSRLYTEMHVACRAGERTTTVGIGSAWENFVISAGTSVEYPRPKPVLVTASV